jgi:hypothetical protein
MDGAPIGAPPPFFCTHDLVRKPDAAFRDHALGGDLFGARRGSQSSDAKTHRENDFIVAIASEAKQSSSAVPN